MFSKCLWFFFFTLLKLLYRVESLSLNTRQGSRVVLFTVLAPTWIPTWHQMDHVSLYYMLYWWFHFKNEIPINRLLTKWKWTHTLDFGPWSRVHSIWGYLDKRSSKMQDQFDFQSQANFLDLFSGGLPGGTGSHWKVRWGRFSIRLVHSCYDPFHVENQQVWKS